MVDHGATWAIKTKKFHPKNQFFKRKMFSHFPEEPISHPKKCYINPKNNFSNEKISFACLIKPIFHPKKYLNKNKQFDKGKKFLLLA